MIAHSESWIQGYHDARNCIPANPGSWHRQDYMEGFNLGRLSMFR
jgi:hypothetical protein